MRKNNANKKTNRRPTKKSRRNKLAEMNFEALETRQMMATVNVADFGARPNDGGSDLGAIQAAIRASKPGDTVLFSGGTFNVSDQLVFSGDRTYRGQNGAVLKGRSGEGQLFKIQSNNVTVTGMTFEGGGALIEKPGGGFNQNINLDYNTFRMDTSGEHPSAITFTSGLQNSKITNSYFTGYNGGFGIYGYNYNGLTIANNEFVNLKAGMHIDAFGNSGNLLVEQNYITGAQGMGMEFQGTASNLKFFDNLYENPNLSSNFNANNNAFAYSLILDKSTNIQIMRNTVLAPQRPDGVGCRIAFEVGGENTLVEQNYVNGVNHVLASNDGVGGTSITLRNNRFMNYLQGVGGIRPGAIRYEGSNNGSTNLSWDINRPKPGIGSKRYGGTNSPAPNPTPAPAPAPTPEPPTADEFLPTAPVNLRAAVTGATSANLFWGDRAYNEDGYRIVQSTDGQNWSQAGTVGANVTTFAATGLTRGQDYVFRVRAFNAAGASAASNGAFFTPEQFDPALGMHLSDMSWTGNTNGWGPAERDMSNGEKSAIDGRMLSLDGKTYAKGLGVHSGSEIKVALNGEYSTFQSIIGLDDEANGQGAVVFEVWADRQLLYTSGKITGQDRAKNISVDVSGKQEMTLVVTSAGGTDFDHADWADARLIRKGGNAPVQPGNPVKGTAYVSDLTWSGARNGWGKVELDRSNGEKATNDGRTLAINGKTYEHGLGVHSYSQVQYALDGKYGTFSADIGIDDEVGNKGSVIFQVWADNVLLYESSTMTGADAAQTINVNVEGREELWLVVNNASDDRYFDHADWADARLTLAPRVMLNNSTYLSDLSATQKTNGWGPVELDRSIGEQKAGDGSAMKLNGSAYQRGLGVHANSKLVYNLDGLFTTFFADIGVDDEVGGRGSVVFQVWADGGKVYDSGTLTGRSATRGVVVNVQGVDQLWLVVNDAGDGKDFDHADWGNARLVA